MNKKFSLIVCLLCLLNSCIPVFSQEDQPAKVSGQVTSYFGDPLEKVEVKFYLLEMESGKYISAEGKFIKSVFTDEKGAYEIKGLPWGEYRVVATASGFPSSEVWRFYLWRNSDRVLNIGLKFGIIHGFPQLKVSGKIKSINETPIQNVSVTLINAFDETEIKQTRTDKNGRYEIEFIQPGQYIIYVSKSGFSVISSSFLVNAVNQNYARTEINKTIDFQLTPLFKPNADKNKKK